MTKKLPADLDDFYRDIGYAIFNAVRSSHSVGHKRTLLTIKSYHMKGDSLASEFIYDLFHAEAADDNGYGLTEDLYKKWCADTAPAGEALGRLVKPQK